MTGLACGIDWGRDPGKAVLTVVEQGPGGIRIIGMTEVARWDETDTWFHAYNDEGKHVLSMKKPAPPRP